MVRRLVVLAVAALGAALFAGEASAQYYPAPPGYYQPAPRPYYQPAPRPYYGGGGYYRRPVQLGRTCVTSRGDCYTRPAPLGAGCRCMIPGFGPKRGNIY